MTIVQSTRSAGRVPSGTAMFLLALAAMVSPAAAQELVGTFKGNGYGAISSGVKDHVAGQAATQARLSPPTLRRHRRQDVGQELGRRIHRVRRRADEGDWRHQPIFTDKTDVAATMRSSSTLSGVNLFNGLITATTIGAVAEVNADAGKIVTSGAEFHTRGSQDRRQGHRQWHRPGSTQILPGLGTVTIKKFDRTGNGDRHSGSSPTC